ncbi:MAG: Gfo/Idh/MocA family oxidoreductase [Eubacteriales bacterium]|nr:Gfo/Idh/MocA family oxidoreductase [Eubacteriales bacterium]
MRRKIKFGIIGCGLMGREFASAAARWCHLKTDLPAPEIAGVCDVSPDAMGWFTDNFPGIRSAVTDYRELLAASDIEAVYCAVPHNLQEEIFINAIKAGKHLLGEKPFGIDKAANDRIFDEIGRHPELVVRCSSEFPYYPACQALFKWISEGRFGRILEVRSGFLHSSDMDVNKAINWKRQAKYNGEYGCMGDLGVHTQHVPFRAGWIPVNVFAKLSKYVAERPDKCGNMADCDTYDNAVLVCDVKDKDGAVFPMYLEMKRMSPGSTNEWYLSVYGLEMSARFNTADPNALCYTDSWGKEQAWARVTIGYKPVFPSITGEIFEFGFTDAILQMWAAFISELDGRHAEFGCFTPEETRWSHLLLTAALESHKENKIADIKY